MEFSHPDYTIQARTTSLQNVLGGLRKVFTIDPGLSLQIYLTIPLIIGGIFLHLNTIQWILVIIVSLLFIMAGVFRTAALLQVTKDTSLSPFHVSRIKSMGNALLAVTSGISLLTYMLIFVPKITDLF